MHYFLIIFVSLVFGAALGRDSSSFVITPEINESILKTCDFKSYRINAYDYKIICNDGRKITINKEDLIIKIDNITH